MEIQPTELTLIQNETYKLKATVYPENATDKTILWTSNDPEIVSVNDEGVITAISEGEATITAKSGDITATCQINVLPEVTQIILSHEYIRITKGETFELTATILPENAGNKSIEWSSYNTAIATIDQNGIVTAVKAGYTILRAKCGKVVATCQIHVDPIHVEDMYINPRKAELLVGKSLLLQVEVSPSNAIENGLEFESQNPEIASIDQDGLITAVSEGDARLFVTCGNISSVIYITVKAFTEITLSQTEAELEIGQTLELKATVSPDNATEPTIEWSSSDESVAIVDQDGQITTIGAGEAIITAKYEDGIATCHINVIPNEVNSIELSQTEAEIVIGESIVLTATILPSTATYKTIEWSSSNPGVASVDQSGRVTANAIGGAYITAKCGKVYADCIVKVVPNEVTSIELSQTEAEIVIGESIVLTATISPSTVTNKTIEWTSSNPDVASVDQEGVITAVALGEATITAKCGNVSADCTIRVLPLEVTAITLSQTEVELVIGRTWYLTATISPSNSTDQTIEWSSTNPEIATVNQDGKVTAVSEGTVTIEACSGNVSASCKVTVKKISQRILWDQTFEEVHDGDTIELTAEATSNLPVTYTIKKGEGVIEGNMLTINGIGEMTLVASQAGNEMYSPAQDVVITFVVIDGILDIIADEDENAVYYTISGVRVESENLEPGFYIVKRGVKTYKVYVK